MPISRASAKDRSGEIGSVMISEQTVTASQFGYMATAARFMRGCSVEMEETRLPCSSMCSGNNGTSYSGLGKPCDRSHMEDYCNGVLDCICLDG